MKYLFLSFLLFGLISCGADKVPGVDTGTSQVPAINVGWVQVSDGGTSVSSDTGNVSVGVDGTVNMTNDQGTISAGDNGASMTTGGNTMTAWKDGVGVGTGIKIPDNSSSTDPEKDPEVQKITKDIDNIFSDIEKGGK